MTKAVPLPGVTFAGATYTREEAVFAPLAPTDPRRRRRLEVLHFRRPPQPPARPRWDISVQDEAHPFPQRPLMHTLQRHEGVEVTQETFPATVRGTGHLRARCRTPLWCLNSEKAARTSPFPSLQQAAPRASFLARVIADESMEEKKEARRGWCASTIANNVKGCIGSPEECSKNYVEINKTKKDVFNKDTYVSPEYRVIKMNESIREKKRGERTQKELASLQHMDSLSVPTVFKMSNIDEWWLLDPTFKIAANSTVTSTENVNE